MKNSLTNERKRPIGRLGSTAEAKPSNYGVGIRPTRSLKRDLGVRPISFRPKTLDVIKNAIKREMGKAENE